MGTADRLYALFGGVIAVTLVGLLVGRALRSQDPVNRALWAAAAAWAICSVAAGFAIAGGGPFRLDAGLYLFPGAIMAFYFLEARYRKAQSGGAPAEQLQGTPE
jgi:hypothetical protein